MTNLICSRDQVLQKYLYLVRYVATRIAANLPASVDINDLINDGVFGLMDAVEKYDGSRAVKFETYAMTRIQGAILDALRSLDWVPRTIRQRARELERAYEHLEREFGRAPTDAELADRLHLSRRKLDRLVQGICATAVVSLEERADTLEDWESDVTLEIERDETRTELIRAVESLPEQERTVVRRYYFNGQTLKTIKGELGVSESRVSQIHSRAVTHLRQRLCETS